MFNLRRTSFCLSLEDNGPESFLAKPRIRISAIAILFACIVVCALTVVYAASQRLGPADTITIKGKVYRWTGTTSVPQDGVQIEIIRDGNPIVGSQSSGGGGFSLAISKGSPVVIVFRYTGYADGRVICGRADGEDQNISVALLRYQDANQWSAAAVKSYFSF